MNIRVRKEVVLCSKCKQKNDFLYLSDFSYGQRLILFDEGRQYAYINLLQDEAFDDYEKQLQEVLRRNNKEIDEENLFEIIDCTFGIACDKILGNKIDFSYQKRKCIYCSSNVFDSLMVEPETIMNVDVPLITHEQWKLLNKDEKEQAIEKELKIRKIL